MPANSVTQTTLTGLVTDRSPICSHLIYVQIPYDKQAGGPGVALNVKVGDVLVVSQRITVRTDYDALGTHVFSTVDGRILLAVVVGGRPDFYDQDLLPGLALSVPKENICQSGNEGHFSLRTDGDGECWVDSRSQRCCTLWGRTYEVQSQSAQVRLDPQSSPARPWASVNFAIREQGFVIRQ